MPLVPARNSNHQATAAELPGPLVIVVLFATWADSFAGGGRVQRLPPFFFPYHGRCHGRFGSPLYQGKPVFSSGKRAHPGAPLPFRYGVMVHRGYAPPRSDDSSHRRGHVERSRPHLSARKEHREGTLPHPHAALFSIRMQRQYSRQRPARMTCGASGGKDAAGIPVPCSFGTQMRKCRPYKLTA